MTHGMYGSPVEVSWGWSCLEGVRRGNKLVIAGRRH